MISVGLFHGRRVQAPGRRLLSRRDYELRFEKTFRALSGDEREMALWIRNCLASDEEARQQHLQQGTRRCMIGAVVQG
jgi:hypothetical protein